MAGCKNAKGTFGELGNIKNINWITILTIITKKYHNVCYIINDYKHDECLSKYQKPWNKLHKDK